MTTTYGPVTFAFQVLGPVMARRDGGEVNLGGEKQRAVLGMLLAAGGGSVDRDVLIEGVWGEDATDANRRSLHTYVSNLRSLIGVEISRSGTAYSIQVDPATIDRFAFEAAMEEARDLTSTAPGDAAERLRTALGWWRGRPYADTGDVPGLQVEVRRLQELRLAAVELRIDADLAQGRYARLVPELESLVAEYPLRERFRSQHMIALYGGGRQAEALRSYRNAEEYLAEEMGLEPSPELRDLEVRILQQDPSLLSGVSTVVTQRRAFLFTDIAGSTRMWDVNPDAMGRALERHDELLRTAIATAGGRPFKHTGDGILAAFPDVTSAISAAEAGQRALQAEDWTPFGELTVRMAVDVGDVDARGDDFYGPPLNRCARIMSAAHGGQVLLSSAAQDELSQAPLEGVQVRYLGEQRFRGLGEVERISQLVFIGLSADFPELRAHLQGPDPTGPGFGDAIRGYELRNQLGSGTFGVVYRAFQPTVGREVAIKVIRPEYANHPGFVRRFETEARLVAKLEHPHIVPLFDYWRDEDGAYLVMRLMRGGTLAPLLGTVWSPGDAQRLLGQVGGALAAAHRQGVVHRDFKPANILLDDDGNAYLADFGIAARIMEPALSDALSSSAPRYRAPEADPDAPTDSTSDVYSLAVLAYELLTGERFGDLARSASVAGLPEELDAVLAQGAAADPVDRYVAVDDFLDAVAGVLGDVPHEPAGRAEVRNPFKGLRPFTESDRDDFFGRDSLVHTLVAAVSRERLVTVVGPSGSGKSSVVHAGLVPALRRGAVPGSYEWLYVDLTPGPLPYASLVTALRSVATGVFPDLESTLADEPGALNRVAAELLDGLAGDVVIVIDQFEELFTVVTDDVRNGFLDMLAEAVEAEHSRVRLVLTLRADFFDRPLGYERIGPLVSAGHVTVIPPTREELVAAIERPARAVGLRYEPGLTARIAADVAGQPGGLPLMQYALAELVDNRTSDLLTAEDYEAIGGITGALGRRAEQVFLDLPASHQAAARVVFLRLVTVDAHADDTRRRARRSELESLDLDPGAISDVVDAFGRHRLLSFDREASTRSPTVEVAHEALLREWPRLRGWVEDERGDLVLGRRFRAAMTDWQQSGRADDYLLTGDRLAPFLVWARTASLTTDEQAFLEASQAADAAAREARRRRRRVLTGVLVGAVVVSLVFGVFAFIQRSDAQDSAADAETQAAAAEAARDEADIAADDALEQQEIAETARDEAEANANDAEAERDRANAAEREATEQRIQAEARTLASQAAVQLDVDPDLALLLAIEAADRSQLAPDAIEALRDVLVSERTVYSYAWPDERPAVETGGDLSPDGGKLVMAAGVGDYLEVRDVDTGELRWSKEFPWVRPGEVRIDGGVFFASGGEEIVGSVVYEPGSDHATNRPPDFVGIHVWDAETGAELARYDVGRCGARLSTAHDSDRYTIMTRLADDWVTEAGCSAIGDRDLATQPVVLERLDVTTGQRTLIAELDAANDVWGAPTAAISADGRVAVYDDGFESFTVRVVVVDSGEVLLAFDDEPPHDFWGYQAVALSPDGGLLAIGGEGNGPALRVFDLATGEALATLQRNPPGDLGARFSADGATLYTIAGDGLVRLYEPQTGQQLGAVLPGDGGGRSVARLSEDGSRLASISLGGAARIVSLDQADRADVTAITNCDGPGFVPSWSIDRSQGGVLLYEFCFADFAGWWRVVDDAGSLQSGPFSAVDELEGSVGGQNVAISPDGRLIAAQPFVVDERFFGEPFDNIAILDAETGELVRQLDGLCRALGFPETVMAPDCVEAPNLPYPAAVWDLDFSRDGALLAMATDIWAPYVHVWDVSTGTTVTLVEGAGERTQLAFSPTDDLLFFGDSSTLRVVDTSDFSVFERETDQGQAPFWAPEFTPDGRYLVAVPDPGSGLADIVVMDPATLDEVVRILDAHEAGVRDVAISDDGRLLASGGTDGVVKVWELGSGQLLETIRVTDGPVNSLAFLKDDRHLIVAPADGPFVVYTLDPTELLQIAKARVARPFTPEECERFLPEGVCPETG